MLRVSLFLIIVLALLHAMPHPASAQEPGDSQPWRFSEVRLGVLAHDVSIAGGREGGVDLNGELTTSTLLAPLWGAGAPEWAQWILHPRAHVGVEPTLSGKTSQLYAGLTWTALLAEKLFEPDDAVEFSLLFGPALNNGDHYTTLPDHKSLGSNILFHVGFEVAYRFTPRVAVGIFFDHSSNGGLARYNQSLNDLGLRVALRF